MSTNSSPTVRRWELAGRLRALREGAGLGIEEVSAQLLCSPSKISRLETAVRGASLRDVRDLCALYQADEAVTEHLMELARQSKEPGWWQSFDEVAPRFATYIGLEDAAVAIRSYETIRMQGLLQTPDYTRALVRRIFPGISAKAAEQFVETRQTRFQQVLEGPTRPDLWVILDEAVLARQVGGPKVMQNQIDHIIKCVDEGLLTLQVVPFAAGAHAGMEGSFTILEFPPETLPQVVYVEGRSGQIFLNRPADLREFEDAFDHLRATAAAPDDSVDLLHRLARSGVV
jgi:transcriptional regulator with XRE-family HTH domain